MATDHGQFAKKKIIIYKGNNIILKYRQCEENVFFNGHQNFHG